MDSKFSLIITQRRVKVVKYIVEGGELVMNLYRT